jgi:4-amino-4-deoxy-L-arabinose transferase-like glycosyltransferase
MAWSYFDHPPLVGWIQWPLVSIDASTGVLRLIPELLWLISCALVFIVTSELQVFLQSKGSIATPALPPIGSSSFAAVLLVIAAPLPHVLSVGLLPDSILAPLSLGLLWMALRWLQADRSFTLRDWLITGTLLGLAGLSKYTAAFAAFALLLVVLCPPRKSWINQTGFYLAVLLALLLISPVLYWNWVNDWISFKYQLAHGSGGEWLFRRFAGFIGLQLLAFGFLYTVGMIFFLKRYWTKSPAAIVCLLGFFWIPFAIFAWLSGGGGLPHWTTPAWFCLAPFAGIGIASAWATQQHRLIHILFLFQITLCLVGFAYVLSGGIMSSNPRNNPIADLYGWDQAGKTALSLSKTHSVAGIAVQNWTLGSRIAWYGRPSPVFILDQRQDQFDLWFGNLKPGSDAIAVNWSAMPYALPVKGTQTHSQGAFTECQALERVEVRHLGRVLSHFDFSLCKNWMAKDPN